MLLECVNKHLNIFFYKCFPCNVNICNLCTDMIATFILPLVAGTLRAEDTAPVAANSARPTLTQSHLALQWLILSEQLNIMDEISK